MTRQDFQKIADAYNRLLNADVVNLAEQYPENWLFSNMTQAIEISDNDYEVLEPFFKGEAHSHYTVGGFEMERDGKIVNFGVAIINHKKYINFSGDYIATDLQSVGWLIRMLGAGSTYKRVPKDTIYGKKGGGKKW